MAGGRENESIKPASDADTETRAKSVTVTSHSPAVTGHRAQQQQQRPANVSKTLAPVNGVAKKTTVAYIRHMMPERVSVAEREVCHSALNLIYVISALRSAPFQPIFNQLASFSAPLTCSA